KHLERAGWATPSALRTDVSLATWQTAAPARFFPGAAVAAAPPPLPRRRPPPPRDIMRFAEQISLQRLHLLRYRDLSFGDPVDWQLDPLAGRRAPLVHWSRLDPLDATTVGDSKVIWELNRHHWMVTLGCAYRLSGDEQYAAAAIRVVREWV